MEDKNIQFGVTGLNPKTSIVSVSTFNKQMNKDLPDTSNAGMWTHARNAVNNSVSGDYLILGNEPSNILAAKASYTIIGAIYLFDNIWAIFSTSITNPNNIVHNNSPQMGCEIGLFNLNNIGNPTQEVYIRIIDDYILHLCQTHLVYGTSRKNVNGEYIIYWDDGLNPTRYLNLGNPERWKWQARDPKLNAWCDQQYMPFDYVWLNTQCSPPQPQMPLTVDVDKLMLIPNIKPAKIYGQQDKNSGGTLPNGLYFVTLAYVLNGNRISDYYISQPIHIYTDSATGGSIDINIAEIEEDNIEEYVLVIVSFVNEQIVAKKMGVYSTKQKHHNFDTIHPTLETVPLSEIPLVTSRYQYSDITTSIGDYLLRISPHEYFEPNYQPLANLIIPQYILAEANEEYYHNSGNMVGYMRDEVYAFYIRWIYKNGNRTPAYYLSGPPETVQMSYTTNLFTSTPNIISNNILKEDNNVTIIARGRPKPFISTESHDSNNVYRYNLSDYINSVILANNPNFNSTLEGTTLQTAMQNYVLMYNAPLTNADICGQQIRLVKFPSENDLINNNIVFDIHRNKKIRILGVQFANIVPPIDNHGKFIEDIIGYEILRADRNGNKTIIAKGIINSYGEYSKLNTNNNFGDYVNGHLGNEKYLYQNYPLNDTRPNNLLSLFETRFIGESFISSTSSTLQTVLSSLIKAMAPYSVSTFNPPCPDYVINGSSENVFNLVAGVLSTIQGGNIILPSAISACNISNLHNVFSKRYFSFHSPDTTFKRPYLNVSEMRIYVKYIGTSSTLYILPQKHPKQKILRKITEFIALISAIGSTMVKLNGRRVLESSIITLDPSSAIIHSLPDGGALPIRAGAKAVTAIISPLINGLISQMEKNGSLLSLNTVGTTSLGIVNTFNTIRDVVGIAASILGGAEYTPPKLTVESTEFNSLSKKHRKLLFLPYFLTSLSTSYSSLKQLYKEISAFRDYALHVVTHGYYDNKGLPRLDSTPLSYNIKQAMYIFNHNTTIHEPIAGQLNIMNKDRNRHVFLSLENEVSKIFDTADYSRFRMLDLYQSTCSPHHLDNIKYNNNDIWKWVNFCNIPTSKSIENKTEALYVGLKVNNDNVYGKIYNNKLLLISTPQLNVTKSVIVSEILFGGDTYIGRYAEKTPFFYFNDYPVKMPDGIEYNYLLQRTIMFPRYWLSTQLNVMEAILDSYPNMVCNQTDFIRELVGGPNINDDNSYENIGGIGQIATSIQNFISTVFNVGYTAIKASLWNVMLSNILSYNMDGNVFQIFHTGLGSCSIVPFIGTMRGIWFYLSHIGIREFWVESEINLAFRQMGDSKSEKYYDYKKNSSLHSFTDEDIIRLEDYYKYDWSMSVSKLYSTFGSFSTVQRYNYDCITSEILSGPRKNMILYSLPQHQDNHKDNWHIFLPLNYKIFDDDIVNVKKIGDTGALLLFKNSSPRSFVGVDTIQTNNELKINIGDGGLFNQPLRASTSSDNMYEYGSVQNKMSIINTPYGIYYIGADQDKIFNYATSIKEISNQGIRWWLTRYCKYTLLSQFPQYDILDNPVIGLGMLSSYDNQNGIIYFHKIDYKLKDVWRNNRDYRFDYIPNTGLFNVVYIAGDRDFIVATVNVHDETYFDDVSWTISYDPKIGTFISFHDWHPSLVGGSQDTFFTIKDDKIYLHNAVCDSYCIFYDKEYPFEVEFETSDGINVSTLRNIEYILEVYKYKDNCTDRFHVLDENFNEMIVYNSEQCTGSLWLYPKPKNNPMAELQYPQFTATHINVLYSKEEQKYRVNNLLDFINDRGEFSGNEIHIWVTEPNGYSKFLNPLAIDYNKPVTQRKRIRHYRNRIFLRKTFNRNNNMYKFLLYVVTTKKLYSSR